MLFTFGSNSESTRVPVFAFHIHHHKSNTHILFDLGLMKTLTAYPPTLLALFPTIFHPEIDLDAADVLREKGGIPPESISHIVLSHPHFDHCGDPARFPNAEVVIGHGTLAFARPAFPINPASRFLESTFPSGRTRELSPADYNTSLGPFPRAHDFFGDGSVLLLDAPGHMPGHMMALCRTARGLVLLAGDAGHHLCHLTEFGEGGRMSYYMHKCEDEARETLGGIRELIDRWGVRVCLAHAGSFEDWEVVEGGGETGV
ncbi:beta-lactamase-like protein [Blyttiomyces helicus]|uniref:Beta-lactamase-like protein n=1 Tax=Blyttiomyces helicus TaxID=388810 RepID=A0A4P9WDK4_9FUNG|nr:beta-lactamase-like protein [Blyttiomyces helicus]|eukprot:RKO89040.1 beta-lactamase-like protein [Blyttiomyces helicus]